MPSADASRYAGATYANLLPSGGNVAVAAAGTYLGKGVYSIAEVARLVGAHPNKIRRWLAPQDALVKRQFDPADLVVGFAELMELHFIKMFRDQGVSLQAIRVAAKAAEKQFGVDYPFAVKRFDTDGRTIFSTLAKEADDKDLVEDLRKGQYVFSNIVRPFFRKLDYSSTADVSHYWPLGKRGRIVLDPRRQFGQPIDSRTGTPTVALYSAVKAGKGQSVAMVAKWFDVSEATVRAAVEFEQSLAS
jgi:DNA-binding transcriptional MerR regulator/uncharacterized protein (DUF433 family)